MSEGNLILVRLPQNQCVDALEGLMMLTLLAPAGKHLSVVIQQVGVPNALRGAH